LVSGQLLSDQRNPPKTGWKSTFAGKEGDPHIEQISPIIVLKLSFVDETIGSLLGALSVICGYVPD
jgi:hypothetical protein